MLSRIETIILCRNCEICLEKNVIVFKNRYGIISTIKSPFKITIDIIDGNRPTLFSLSDSKSKDHQLHIVNEENNEITINLSENNLADYRFQIQQDVLDIYGKEALKSEFESIDQKISNRNLLFLVLGLSIVWFVFLALKKLI